MGVPPPPLPPRGEDYTWMSVRLIARGGLSDILLFIVNPGSLGFFEFPWMGVLFFPRDLDKMHFFL